MEKQQLLERLVQGQRYRVRADDGTFIEGEIQGLDLREGVEVPTSFPSDAAGKVWVKADDGTDHYISPAEITHFERL